MPTIDELVQRTNRNRAGHERLKADPQPYKKLGVVGHDACPYCDGPIRFMDVTPPGRENLLECQCSHWTYSLRPGKYMRQVKAKEL